jgi:hypothetical protein
MIKIFHREEEEEDILEEVGEEQEVAIEVGVEDSTTQEICQFLHNN